LPAKHAKEREKRKDFTFLGRSAALSPMSPCGEFGFPPEADSKKQGKLGQDVGRAARGAILMYAQAREARRQPKIAAAFFEPNSPHCRERNIIELRAMSTLEQG
jgi:hypothetical protein